MDAGRLAAARTSPAGRQQDGWHVIRMDDLCAGTCGFVSRSEPLGGHVVGVRRYEAVADQY